MKKVRLVRVVLQLDLVTDEDGLLTPLEAKPIQITAGDWPRFAATGFDAMVANLEAQLNASVPQNDALEGSQS